MISINFSCFFHLIIIYMIGLFLISFFNTLYDHLIAFNLTKEEEQKEYEKSEYILDQKVAEIHQSIEQVNHSIKIELHALLETQNSRRALSIHPEKKIDDTISQAEQEALYQICQKIVMLLKNK